MIKFYKFFQVLQLSGQINYIAMQKCCQQSASATTTMQDKSYCNATDQRFSKVKGTPQREIFATVKQQQ